MNKRWFNVVLANFVVAALMGAILRFAFVEEISWLNFRYFLHGHSHLAMLGWVYLALFLLLVRHFPRPEKRDQRQYTYLFWATQITVVGMAVAFPIQGYAPVSIAFSTLHILLSYLFAYRVIRDLPRGGRRPPVSRWFFRAAFAFMILSTQALWAMGPILTLGHKGSAWYYMSVQFFLHFQFNGWFLFAVLALFFRFLEREGIEFSRRDARHFFWLLTAAVLGTYALAVAWAKPLVSVFVVNSLGVLLQLAALFFFLRIIWKSWGPIGRSLRPDGRFSWSRILLATAFFAFVAKVIVQTTVVIPAVAQVAYTIRNYVIGFIHLILLAVISAALLAFAQRDGLIGRNRWMGMGFFLFLSGMIFSEGLLFLQGTLLWSAMGFLPYYYEGLFGLSALMSLGLLCVLLGNLLVQPE